KSITDGPEPEDDELTNYGPDGSTGFRIIGQCFNSYILVETDESLWLVDQHAAHERIMYTRLKEQYEHAETEISQVLAFPLAVELPANQIEKIEQNMQLFDNFGFSLELIGYNSVLIRATPGFITGKEKEVVLEILTFLNEKDTFDFTEKVITMMSCKKAIKAGSALNRDEMEKLFADLLTVPGYKNCPHGRPTLIRLDHVELDRMFKR
ncbi:MAG: hypothetical protein PHR65_09515, partial [Syntrophomonadaceae bacterium]|nr:hypothetical protein [Syntrophomonadaceae bacterium]